MQLWYSVLLAVSSVLGVGQSGRTLEVFTGSEYFLTGSSFADSPAFSCLH